jgi:hypothetical protein
MPRAKDIRENTMSKLKFEEIHIQDQIILMEKLMEMIVNEGCSRIAEFAEARGQTPFEVWPDVCAEAGLDECEPWTGYPDKAISLETIRKSPGATRAMTGEWLKRWENYKARTGRDKD